MVYYKSRVSDDNFHFWVKTYFNTLFENAFKHLNTCTIKRSHVLTIVDNHIHICWVQYHNGQSEAFINLLNSVQNAFLGEPTPFKGVVHIQNSVIIYTPSCHFKPVWITVLCRILNNVGNRTAQPPFTVIIWTQNQCKWMGSTIHSHSTAWK